MFWYWIDPVAEWGTHMCAGNFKTVDGDLINEISYLSCDSPGDIQVFLVGFTLWFLDSNDCIKRDFIHLPSLASRLLEMPMMPHVLFSYQSRWAWVSDKSCTIATNMRECPRYTWAARVAEDPYLWATGVMRPQLPSSQIHNYMLTSKFQHLNQKPSECELPSLKPAF